MGACVGANVMDPEDLADNDPSGCCHARELVGRWHEQSTCEGNTHRVAAASEGAANSTMPRTNSQTFSDHRSFASPFPWPARAKTVMVRNIPNRYIAEELLADMLQAGIVEGTFDFFYLPMDFQTKRNRGYGFINFPDVHIAEQFARMFHGSQLQRYTTSKVVAVAPATTQGYDANVAKYMRKDAKRIQNPWFRPLIFRDAAVE